MSDLTEARQKINRIDSEMVKLFEERMKAVCEVASYKKGSSMPVFDAARESKVVAQNTSLLEDPALATYYEKFIRTTMQVSKQYQKKLMNAGIVGYQGVPGAYSHIAKKALFPNYEERSYPTWEDVCKALMADEIAWGILPFENSYTGEVGDTLDLLYQYDLHITDIYDLKISHDLLGVKGASLKDIKRVYSHPQAFLQCGRFLDGYDFVRIPCLNTAAAAKKVSEEKDTSAAAIASFETASIYGLDVLASDISTSTSNTTRFVVVSKEALKAGSQFSLLFTVDHTAGRLAAVMEIIAKYGFNMECIRSKPIRSIPWQYYFYVEMDGNILSKKAKELIREMKSSCRELKLLGSYRKE